MGRQLVLPINEALKNPQTERQAIVLRLRQMGVLVAGCWDKDEHGKWLIETSQLKDIMEKQAYQYLNKLSLWRPDEPEPDVNPEEIREMLKDIKDYRDHLQAGTKRLY
jgi:hypothetical protein